MLDLVRRLSETSASSTLREIDWLIPTLQTIHILAIAMVMSSLLMIDLRVLRMPMAQSQSIANAVHRFESWIWAGLAVLAATGAIQVLAEPQRTMLNGSFQVKMILLGLAVAATCALKISLRRNAEFANVSGKATGTSRAIAVCTSLLWCAVAASGRLIAYTQPI